MSSLWTPSGERPVGRTSPAPPPPPADPGPARAATPRGAPDLDAELDQHDVEALRDQLAQTPAAVVVVNHVFGLFELAALHLSLAPPQLEEARVAIDAAGAVLDGVSGRLGEDEPTAREALTQIRLAFVQIQGASGG
jgi:hypothetical protein